MHNQQQCWSSQLALPNSPTHHQKSAISGNLRRAHVWCMSCSSILINRSQTEWSNVDKSRRECSKLGSWLWASAHGRIWYSEHDLKLYSVLHPLVCHFAPFSATITQSRAAGTRPSCVQLSQPSEMTHDCNWFAFECISHLSASRLTESSQIAWISRVLVVGLNKTPHSDMFSSRLMFT